MIHLASPQSRQAVIVAGFWSFCAGRTDNMCENSDNYRPGMWSASWINSKLHLLQRSGFYLRQWWYSKFYFVYKKNPPNYIAWSRFPWRNSMNYFSNFGPLMHFIGALTGIVFQGINNGLSCLFWLDCVPQPVTSHYHEVLCPVHLNRGNVWVRANIRLVVTVT